MAKDSSQEQTSRRLSQTVSLASLAFVVLILTSVLCWHGGQTKQIGAKPQSDQHLVLRFLQQVDEDNKDTPASDDDHKRSETCKKYLYNFLNGTTDSNDQCQAFYTAYKAADCEDDTHVDILAASTFTEDDKNKNKTGNDDDVLSKWKSILEWESELLNPHPPSFFVRTVDDFFENWECCDSIQSFYEKNCEAASELHSSRLLGIMLVMLVCTMIKAMLKTFNIHWLPDACAFILVGTFVGLFLRLVNKGILQNRLSFDNDLFLQIMLPPIIFQAALSIDKKAFRRDLFPILAFAGLGTAFSAVGIGLITHHVSKLGSDDYLPLLDSLVFGALISSVDPVATLSILSGVGVSQTDTLYTLIFGESLLNDGVAIVLFDTLKSHLGGNEELGPDAYRDMAKHFFAVLFGMLLGYWTKCSVACDKC